MIYYVNLFGHDDGAIAYKLGPIDPPEVPPLRHVRVPSKYPDTFAPRRHTCAECKRRIHGRGLVSNGAHDGSVGKRVHERCAGVLTPGFRSTFVSYG